MREFNRDDFNINDEIIDEVIKDVETVSEKTVEEPKVEASKKEAPETEEIKDEIPKASTSKENHTQETHTTYSWVNPKLRTSRNKDGVHNVWDSGNSENNYWTERTESSANGNTTHDKYYSYVNQNDKTSDANYEEKTAHTKRSGYANAYTTGKSTHISEEQSNQERPHEKKAKSGNSNRSWMKLVAMALVFGLIAGSVTYATNRLETAVLGTGIVRQGDSGKSQQQEEKKVEQAQKVETPEGSVDTAKIGEEADVNTGAGTVADVAANCMPALVTISTMSVQEMQSFFGGKQSYEVAGAGTGVIVSQTDDELLIATNNHVIEGAKEVSVGFIDETAVKAAIKGRDTDNDLAIVAVQLSDIPQETVEQIKVVAIGDSDELVLGEQVVAIGNALGLGQSVTSGYISAFNRELNLSDGTNEFTSTGLIQTDASINSGNSGGALLNMKGELVGINEAKSSGSSTGASVDNVGYSIPTAKAMPILETLMDMETRVALEEEDQGYLGIHCVDVSEESSRMYNIPMGVYVSSVVAGGPAEKAGLQQGDVITSINSVKTESYKQLTEELRFYAPDTTVTLTIQRASDGGYQESSVEITLAEKSILDNEEQDTSEDNSNGLMTPDGDDFDHNHHDEQEEQQEEQDDDNGLFGGGSLWDEWGKMFGF